MGIKTIMVHLELGGSNKGLLGLTNSLAERFDAAVIGIAACQPIQIPYDETYVSGEILEEDRKEIRKQLDDAEQQFRGAFARTRILDCRTSVDYFPLCDYIVEQASAADLIVTGTDVGGSMFDSTRRVNIADLVMQAGRPVLIVPKDTETLNLDHVVVAWKGNRESRLAVVQALPFLRQAGDVTVFEIAPKDGVAEEESHVGDVVAWLGRHGIKAQSKVIPAAGEDTVQLAAFAAEANADLIIAGAYGHSRAREWALGGMTHDFLLNPDRPVLVSH